MYFDLIYSTIKPFHCELPKIVLCFSAVLSTKFPSGYRKKGINTFLESKGILEIYFY